MTPKEIYQMDLWEYNAYVKGYELKQKASTVQSILTGYYCAYYLSSNKNTKQPKELIQQLYSKPCSLESEFEKINKIKNSTSGGKNG